jgi:Glycosyl hydrolases family 39
MAKSKQRWLQLATRTAMCLVVCLSAAGAQVTVNFGSRNSVNTPHVVPPQMFATQVGYVAGASNKIAAFNLMKAATVNQFRVNAYLEAVFPNSNMVPNWSAATSLGPSFDALMTMFQSNGVHPLIMMGYTPSWLAQKNVPAACQGTKSAHAEPTNFDTWATLAATVVQHLDSNFPGLVTDYEIWNEPDLVNGLCVQSTENTMTQYISLYGKAAAAMHARAATAIRVGGPALTSGGAFSTWIPALLKDATAGPQVDFISYHQYLGGPTDISNHQTWFGACTTSGQQPLYCKEQSSTTGLAARYRAVTNAITSVVPAGLPIYITEFNDNWAFTSDCCRNDPNFSPLFNALAVADYLNASYNTAIKNILARLLYFSASTPPMCLVGVRDTNFDCAYSSTNLQEYPQLATYRLIGSNLGLAQGGRMPASITQQANLVTTAFYTAKPTSAACSASNSGQDSILLVNPAPTALSNVVVNVKNPGTLNSTTAAMYTLNGTTYANVAAPIAVGSAAFTKNATTGVYTTTIGSLPANTVIGLKLPACP